MLRRADGSAFPAELDSGVVRSADGAELSYVIFRDVTERHWMEDGLRRSNRALRLLTLCNEAMVRATTQQALLSAVCEAMVATGGYRMCWVGMIEHDGSEVLRPVAHAGHEDGYLAVAEVVWSDAALAQDPAAAAVRTGKVVVHRDLEGDPTLAPWKDAAAARGYRACAALPLVFDGRPIGAMTFYSGQTEVAGRP